MIVAEVSVPVHLHLLTARARSRASRACWRIRRRWASASPGSTRTRPALERVSVASNAEAARLASVDPAVAAIAGDRAAVRYGLQTVAALIQDDAHNRTRFVVLGRQADAAQRQRQDLAHPVGGQPRRRRFTRCSRRWRATACR